MTQFGGIGTNTMNSPDPKIVGADRSDKMLRMGSINHVISRIELGLQVDLLNRR